MKVYFILFAFYLLNGICSADGIKYKNLAIQAKITASSELKEQGLKASSVADGRIAPALCQHFEFFPSHKAAKSWAVNGETAEDKGDLVFEWNAPVFLQELIYFGRTAWLLDECFKDYVIIINDNEVPAAEGSFKKMHGGQRVTFNRQKVKKLILRFLNSHGGPNPGATEVLLVDKKLSDSELIQMAPANPPTDSQVSDPISVANLTWTKPSIGEEEAMPIGNGSLLANVWAEKGGDVLVSLARYSKLDDSAKRIGTLRFQFDPGLNTSRDSFRQMLRFKYGEVVVKNIKQKENPSYSFFVDAKRDILHLQFRSKGPVPLRVIFDDDEGKLLSLEDKKQIAKINGRDALVVLCDEMKTRGNELQAIDARTAFDLQVHLVSAKEDEQLDEPIGSVSKVDVNGAVSTQIEVWNKFWNRGSIFLGDIENGSEISRALILRRHLSASSGRGPHALNPEAIKEIEIPEKEILYWKEEKSEKAIKDALESVKPSLEIEVKGQGVPQFWGSNFSELPPIKDGVDALVASLRPLLIEATGKRVCLFPGWPLDQDISFRMDTVTGLGVEVVYRDQEIKRLEVYPKQRTNEVFGLGPFEKKVREALPGPFKMPALISFLSPSWVGPRVGLDNLFVTMKRANFNGLEGSLADFEKSKEAGIYLLLHGVTPWSAHALKGEKTLISYYMSDRRKPSSFPYFGTIRQKYESIDPNHPTEFTTYSQYGGIEFFLDAVRPRMLEYYDYHWQRQAHLHFHFLEYYRRMSIAAGGIPVFRFVHVHGDNVIKMRQTVSMSLAYGIKAFKWWVGWTMFDIHKVVETEPPPLSDIGKEVLGINNTIASFSPSLTNARSLAVYHTDPLPTSTVKAPDDYWVRPEGKNIVMGVFEGSKGEQFIVLGNRDIGSQNEVIVNFSGKVKSIQLMNKQNREWKAGGLIKTDQAKSHFKLKIKQGDAELIKVVVSE
ncbi:MAG: hypothetical protein EVB09_01380 [Verrucomicrobiaceae bacterium]|nr:MAG: hypothetical protein EVB09_01380 [Verrucomicrobiaceae bacterium]